MSSPQVVSAIVTRFERLKQLTDRVARLRELEALLQKHLPSPLSQHVTLAALRDGCLVIQADGAAWSAELRYKGPEILAHLRSDPEFAGIRSIRVRNIKKVSARSTNPPRACLSRRSAMALEEQAACTENGALREVLMRLASRGKD